VEKPNQENVVPASSPLTSRMVVRNTTRNTQLGDQVELASSGANRSKGLLGRRGLAPGGGLWIIPCESVHTFFMHFPIDLIYIDRKYRVRKVAKCVVPWRLSACLSAHSVLELPVGTIQDSKTEAGDILEIVEATLGSLTGIEATLQGPSKRNADRGKSAKRQNRHMRFRTLFTILLVSFVCVILFAAALMAANRLPVQDFAQYWTAARLFTHDPYSISQTQAFEKSSGLVAAPLIVKNPPWAIVLLLPLGALSYHSAFAIWAVISVCIVAACSKAVWNQIGSGPSLAPALLSMLFGPTIVLLMLGQFTVLVLLGAVLFCLLLKKRRDWLAGASLLLVLGKPHIALLFLIAAALWTLFYRRWIVLVSGTLALMTASIAATIMNPHIFAQFWRRTMLVVNETESYPNFGGMLYEVSGMHILALLPQLAGLVWLVFYWRRNRFKWDWEKHGLIVLLCSVACSYYSYPYDEILALPALLLAFAKGDRRVFLAVFALTNLGYGLYISDVIGRFGFGYMFLWWTATGWLLTSFLALRRVGGELPLSE